MKYYTNKANLLISNILNDKIKALLLYGPDRGYINKLCAAIIKKLDLMLTTNSDQNLSSSQFSMLVNTRNFFNKKECIKITIKANLFEAEYKSILQSDFTHFPIFIADELPLKSEIRKFFELEPYLAAMGCYYSDEQTIEKLILHKMAKINKQIDNDALQYLRVKLEGDYQLINNELDKLVYFAHDVDRVGINEVRAVISDNIEANGDDLCVCFIKNDLTNLLDELDKLLKQNINMVLIIRALIRYYMNIYIVLSHMKNGVNLDEACKTLSPPIFFKQLDNFKKIAISLTITNVTNALAILQQAEMEFKLQNNNFDFYQQIYCRIFP